MDPGASGDLFLQNKANFLGVRMNANGCSQRDYENKQAFGVRESKANLYYSPPSTPSSQSFLSVKTSVSVPGRGIKNYNLYLLSVLREFGGYCSLTR